MDDNCHPERQVIAGVEPEFAKIIPVEETANGVECWSDWNWTGWRNRHWVANVEWIGRRIYAFDKRPQHRCFYAILEITHGGAFEYRTPRDYSLAVRRLCEWLPARDDPHFDNLPFVGPRERPCTGLAIRWRVVQRVNIPRPDLQFPRIGWLRLSNTPERPYLDSAELYSEGDEVLRLHRAYERNPRLRQAARLYWLERMRGTLRCLVCDFSFGDAYGDIGNGFIELHHEEPLSQARRQKKRRVTDLVPVCSNCHRMLHRNPHRCLTVDELRCIHQKHS